jgi:hypothetical protein
MQKITKDFICRNIGDIILYPIFIIVVMFMMTSETQLRIDLVCLFYLGCILKVVMGLKQYQKWHKVSKVNSYRKLAFNIVFRFF